MNHLKSSQCQNAKICPEKVMIICYFFLCTNMHFIKACKQPLIFWTWDISMKLLRRRIDYSNFGFVMFCMKTRQRLLCKTYICLCNYFSIFLCHACCILEISTSNNYHILMTFHLMQKGSGGLACYLHGPPFAQKSKWKFWSFLVLTTK